MTELDERSLCPQQGFTFIYGQAQLVLFASRLLVLLDWIGYFTVTGLYMSIVMPCVGGPRCNMTHLSHVPISASSS